MAGTIRIWSTMVEKVDWLPLLLLLLSLSRLSCADFAHDLTEATFAEKLKAAKEPWALVEFFASWCPACQNFKPQYDRVAQLFNDPSSPHSGLIYVARLDCATDMNLCRQFEISRLPSMFFGPPASIAAGNLTDGQSPVGFERLTNHEYTAQGVLDSINLKLERMFTFPEKGVDPMQAYKQFGGGKDDVAQEFRRAKLHDMEEATIMMLNNTFAGRALTPQMRPKLEQLLDALSKYHPSPKCRDGTLAALNLLQTAWPQSATDVGRSLSDVPSDSTAGSSGSLSSSNSSSSGGRGGGGSNRRMGSGFGSKQDQQLRRRALADLAVHQKALASVSICGRPATNRWIHCNSNIKGRRGYSCGLWLLFHSLSLRTPEEDGGRIAVGAMHTYITSFFGCDSCVRHFSDMADRLLYQQVVTQKQGALWIWHAHNEVNQRLAKEEEAASTGTRGDPQHPKRQWPTATLCKACISSSSGGSSSEAGQGEENPKPDVWKQEGVAGRWSMPDVYAFLKEYYEEPDTEQLKQEQEGPDAQHSLDGVHKLGGGFVTAEGGERRGDTSMIFIVVTGCVLLAVAAACTWQLVRRSYVRASPHRRRKLPE